MNRHSLTVTLLFLGLALAACGGGDGPVEPPEHPEDLLRAEIVASSLPLNGVSVSGELSAVLTFGEANAVQGFNADGTDFFTLSEGLSGRPVDLLLLPGEGELFIGEASGRVVKFNVPPGRVQAETTAHEGGLTSLLRLPGGNLLTSGGDGFTRVWNRSLEQQDEFEPGAPLEHAEVTPGGDLLAVMDGQLTLLNPEDLSGLEQTGFGGERSASALAAGDGLFLAGLDQGAVNIYEPSRLGLRATLGVSAGVNDLARLPSGLLLAGLDDGSLVLIDPLQPAVLKSVPAHSGELRGVAVLGDRVYTVGRDRRMRIWSVPALTD